MSSRRCLLAKAERRWFTALVLPLLNLALVTGCAPHYRHVVERPLASKDELTCPGYLVWNDEPVRDVFLVINGSGMKSNAFVHPTFEGVMKTRHTAYVTYDKPGIAAPFGTPQAVRHDDALFEHYTLGHGVACATKALRWAREQFGPSVRLHLRGHSEGTLVALYTYEALLDDDAALARSVKTLILSGVALEAVDDLIARQIAEQPDYEKALAALASCDWEVLKVRMGASCTYLEDAALRPTGRAMFERLAARSASARFYVFHGTNDQNTPVEPVRELEAWNTSHGHLAMTVHYYDGAHAGSPAARAEVARLLTALASE